MPLDLPAVPLPDSAAAEEASEVRRRLPVGALGVWGAVVDMLAACAGSADGPIGPHRPQLVVFAADHGIADIGVSAAPGSQTRTRAMEVIGGTGLTRSIADAAQVGVTVLDVGMTEPSDSVPRQLDDAGPSGRIDVEDAMTAERTEAAFSAGRAAADAEVDQGSTLLIGAVCGVGVSTPVAALTAALTGMEPVDATSRGSGIDDTAWIRKAAAVRDALFRIRRGDTDVLGMLRVGGGPDLAALTGFLVQAAIRRTPVLIHDMPSTTAAVLAHRIAPGADNYQLVTSLAPDRGHQRLLDLLGRDPLTDWSITGHSGVAALLVLPALLAAGRAFDAVDRTAAAAPLTPSAISTWDASLL